MKEFQTVQVLSMVMFRCMHSKSETYIGNGLYVSNIVILNRKENAEIQEIPQGEEFSAESFTPA